MRNSNPHQVDVDKLYKEVVRTKKPFYQWPQWIEETMRRKLFVTLYGGGKRNAGQLQLQEAAREVTVTMAEPVRFKDNFFTNSAKKLA